MTGLVMSLFHLVFVIIAAAACFSVNLSTPKRVAAMVLACLICIFYGIALTEYYESRAIFIQIELPPERPEPQKTLLPERQEL